MGYDYVKIVSLLSMYVPLFHQSKLVGKKKYVGGCFFLLVVQSTNA